MIHYSLQVVVFQLIFIVIYDVFLKRETFFNYNRTYLIITNGLSLLLPIIKIEGFQTLIPTQYTIGLPEVAITNAVEGIMVSNETFVIKWGLLIIQYLFYIGMLLAFIAFLFKIVKLFRLISINPKRKTKKITIVTLLNSNAAFSFFNYVFIGELLEFKAKQSILAHENIHVKEKHTLDLMFFELQRILFWFNPLVYIYQKRIALLHEFIADDKVTKMRNKKEYYKSLLSEAFSVNNISFINPFFKQSLIKKRIIMLSKSKSKQRHLFKYSLLIPAIIGMLFYSACSQQNVGKKQDNNLKKASTEVGKKESDFSEKETVNSDEVAFFKIDSAPIFPGCEAAENKKKCFSKQMINLVAKNFNTKLADNLNLNGTQEISMVFKISKTGEVKEIEAKAAHPELEKEGIRVIGLLPKLLPGRHNGKAVTVPYSLPIKFEIKA